MDKESSGGLRLLLVNEKKWCTKGEAALNFIILLNICKDTRERRKASGEVDVMLTQKYLS